MEVMEDVGKRWKTCGRQGRGAGGPEEVWKAMGKCGRGGKAREIMVHYTHAEAVYLSLEVLDLTFRTKANAVKAERKEKYEFKLKH